MDDQNKNLILATALSFLVILVWFLIFPPEDQVEEAAPTATERAEEGSAQDVPDAGAPAVAPAPPGGQRTAPTQTGPPETPARAEAERVAIETPRLTGSISLRGGRIDDLYLRDYQVTLDPDSDEVRLLSPADGQQSGYYALHGWAPAGTLARSEVPGADTSWTLAEGDSLAPGSPITLRWENDSGVIFRRRIAIDDDYLFTITQSVENTTDRPLRMAPYGIVARHGPPDVIGFFILHEGVVRQVDDELTEMSYSDLPDLDVPSREGVPAELSRVESNGWIGFTDKYWMTTLIPNPGQSFTAVTKYVPDAQIYQVESRLPTLEVPPGATAETDTQLFAGAKEWETILYYQKANGFLNFVDSIDWGWFFFLTKPIFVALHNIHDVIGNMGWSIIVLTLAIKALLLPLAYKSYVSMAKMKELQPEMEKIKERAGDDRQKLQQEMMALYKNEKVNPASGCLPILLQIPIFFSLYKVIFVTIELRHAPWIGWIRDLSSPDPSSILNLFGLLPYSVPELGVLEIVSIGVLPILLGTSMWLQQKLNPTPADKTQAMIFAWMPWVFMFMLGRFAAGLVLYWIANNTLTFLQQYAIMRSQGYRPDIFGNIRASFRRRKTSGE